jgi:uncharacterized iron-regulated membrane protein
MKDGFRQSMAWLHTWSGLLVCWILFLVFSAGTASYFRNEITLWMKPELHRAAAGPVTQADAAAHAMRTLQERGAHAPRWFITLPDERSPATRIRWTNPTPPGEARGARARPNSEMLDPATGDVLSAARETRGGEFFYRLHFDLHYMPALWARWIIGFCAMFMLVAIISGIITHKRIFKDFFTFRPRKGQRSWLDAHNATAVLALPYHLMITYTGLVTLMFMYMPWGAQVAYNGDRETFFAEAFPNTAQKSRAAGETAPLTAITPLLQQASLHWQGGRAALITVNHPGDKNATISIVRAGGRDLTHARPSMLFNGVSGALISTAGDDIKAASETRGVLYGLHIAHFAGPLLRMLFFLSGLAGCAMVATGALLWAVKERQKHAKALAQGGRAGFGLRLVEGLNIGAIAGLPIAFATYFWANRLLPVQLEQRPEIEIRCFFIAWAVAALLAQLRPTRRMWQLQLWTGAALFAGIPLLNVATTHSHLGVTLLHGEGPWAVAGFDLIVLALGAGLGYAAWTLGRNRRPARRTQKGVAPNDIPDQPVREAA